MKWNLFTIVMGVTMIITSFAVYIATGITASAEIGIGLTMAAGGGWSTLTNTRAIVASRPTAPDEIEMAEADYVAGRITQRQLEARVETLLVAADAEIREIRGSEEVVCQRSLH